MKYRIRRSINCAIHNGHFYHVGQRVKINLDKLSTDEGLKSRTGRPYAETIAEYGNVVMRIKYIQIYDKGEDTNRCVGICGFPHLLELDDLIIVGEAKECSY
jgi:hypothetical protein